VEEQIFTRGKMLKLRKTGPRTCGPIFGIVTTSGFRDENLSVLHVNYSLSVKNKNIYITVARNGEIEFSYTIAITLVNEEISYQDNAVHGPMHGFRMVPHVLPSRLFFAPNPLKSTRVKFCGNEFRHFGNEFRRFGNEFWHFGNEFWHFGNEF